MPVYLTLQPIRCAARNVAIAPGELLPRLFTLTARRRRLFSVTLLCRHRQLPVRKYGTLCCPDFPLAVIMLQATGHCAVCTAKVHKKIRFYTGRIKRRGLFPEYPYFSEKWSSVFHNMFDIGLKIVFDRCYTEMAFCTS